MTFCVCGHSKKWHSSEFPFACFGQRKCPCKRFMPKAADVVPASFTDAAKQSHGIRRDPPAEIAMLEAELERVRNAHAAEIASVREWFKSALAALEAGRRGDALKMLRQQAGNGGGSGAPVPEPTESNRA